MSKYICVEDFANELKDFCCKPCKENGEDKEGYQCGSCSVMYLVGAVDAFPAADVAPRTNLGVFATARAIELLTASMEFLRKVKDTNEYEDCMSILCEYDYTLNDGYCLLNDIEDFFEIIDNEE